jgi:hypothetical protein
MQLQNGISSARKMQPRGWLRFLPAHRVTNHSAFRTMRQVSEGDPYMRCKLVCSSNHESLSQIFTGFAMLARQGKINFKMERAKDYAVGKKARPVLRVITNNKHLVFDTADDGAIFKDELDWSDYYFKRSYDPAIATDPRVRPLGLNYVVFAPGDRAVRRIHWSLLATARENYKSTLVEAARASTLLSRLTRFHFGRHISTVEAFEDEPRPDKEPKVLLLTKPWDAGHVRSPERAEERRCMNLMRAECVRLLRKEFGKRFLGGFAPTPLSLKEFKEYVVDDSITNKGNYLRLVRDYTICATSTGLQRSNGWRLAEYVAASKAILSEPLHYRVTGEFRPNKNYLEFTTPEECVESAVKLASDRTLRAGMMRANLDYYRSFVRPDSLVWNALGNVNSHEDAGVTVA